MASPGFVLTGSTSNEVRQIDADNFDAFRKRIIERIASQIPNTNQRLAGGQRTLAPIGHLPRSELQSPLRSSVGTLSEEPVTALGAELKADAGLEGAPVESALSAARGERKC
jgi:hypothetical protein